MCQAITRALSYRPESCQVRKVASLLTEPLRTPSRRRRPVAYLAPPEAWPIGSGLCTILRSCRRSPLGASLRSVGHGGVLEIKARRCDEAEALPLALSQITCLLCLDEFDTLSLLRHAGEDGVYLHSQEHHKPRHVEP